MDILPWPIRCKEILRVINSGSRELSQSEGARYLEFNNNEVLGHCS
jgi:hypothetical protein